MGISPGLWDGRNILRASYDCQYFGGSPLCGILTRARHPQIKIARAQRLLEPGADGERLAPLLRQAKPIRGTGKVVYVSTAWALGPSGRAPGPSTPRDEAWSDEGPYLSAYHRSKAEAHRVALRWRAQGLPVVTAMPNGVMGTNDHSSFGYFLRLTLLGQMPPMAWGGDAVYALVDVNALAEGLCLAAEKARVGEDYLFCGPRQTLRELFDLWGRKTGKRVPRWYLPRWFMRPQMALMEPLQRLAGLPAFMSRDTVDATRAHLDYSSAKAQRDLGWTHPDTSSMWDAIIKRERELMAARHGFLDKLRHQPVVDAPAIPS